MKRILCLATALLLIAGVFAGCGKNVNETEKSGQSQPVTTASETTASEKKEPVEVSWLVLETPNLNAGFWKTIFESIEAANQGIKLKKEIFPDNNRPTYLKLLYSTNQMPDMFWGGETDLIKIDALEAFDQEFTSLIQDEVVESKMYNGKLSTIPLALQIKQNMFYNKKYFADNNLAVPKTWDEFLNVCETLKNKGIVPIITGGPDTPYITGSMAEAMINFGLRKYDPDWRTKMKNGELKWNSPVIKDIFQRWIDLIDKGYFHEGSFSFTYAQLGNEFLKGSAAMMCDGMWFAKQVDSTPDVKFDVGWFSLPYPDGVAYYNAEGAGTIAIPKSSKHIQEAKQCIKYILTDADTYKTYLKADGMFSTLKADVKPDLTKTQQEIVNGTKGLEVFPRFVAVLGEKAPPPGFESTFQKACQAMFIKSPLDAELDKLEKTYRDLINASK